MLGISPRKIQYKLHEYGAGQAGVAAAPAKGKPKGGEDEDDSEG